MNDELDQDTTSQEEESPSSSHATEAKSTQVDTTEADATETDVTETDTTEANTSEADSSAADTNDESAPPEEEPGAKNLFDAFGSDDSHTEEESAPEPTIESVFGKAEPKEEEETFTFPPDEPESEEPPEKPKAPARASASADSDSEDEDEDQEEQEPLIVDPPDDGIKRRWFAIHAHSGQEANVRRNLVMQAEIEGLSNLVTNVLVPMEEIEEFRSGEKRRSKRKYFPGYVLVQLPEHPEHNPDLWHLIKNTPGVTGFIGSRTVPVPLEDSEVIAIVEEISGERERPRKKIEFELSERVKIIDGPFSNFLGNIDEINEERGKMKILVEIFERQTSVEVDYWQVEKI